MTVTAVVPTKNRSHLLRATLRSILAQHGVEVEVIVVDDGSGAAEAEQIRALETDKVRVLRNASSRGAAAARNVGIEAAKTRWVAFCDDDDLWTPTKLARQLSAAQDADAAWAYTGAVKFADGPVVWQVMPAPSPAKVLERLAYHCIIPAGASNVLADRRTVLEAGGFDADLKHFADWDMWLRLLDRAVPASAEGIGVAYRLHPSAMSLNHGGILNELGSVDCRWRHLRGDQRLDPAATHLWIAMSHLRAHRRLEAAVSYIRAARTQPAKGLRGALRTLHPAAPAPPHRVDSTVDAKRFSLKRVKAVELPEDVKHLLRDYAPATSRSDRG